MKQKTKGNELGRSMVEMLGVLAVIGVLTVGALFGYRQAMDKSTANTIIHEVQLRATTAMTQMEVGKHVNLSEFEEKILEKYTVTAQVALGGQSFTIYVSDVPEGPLKKMITDKFGGLRYWAVGVNSENDNAMVHSGRVLASQETGNILIKSALADINETNTIWFEFKKNLASPPELPSDDIKRLGTEYSRCVYSE